MIIEGKEKKKNYLVLLILQNKTTISSTITSSEKFILLQAINHHWLVKKEKFKVICKRNYDFYQQDVEGPKRNAENQVFPHKYLKK